MSYRWLSLAIPSVAAAALLVAVAACSSATSQPAAGEIAAHDTDDDPAAGSCPYSGATGKSDLSLEEVLRRVHEKESSSCPYMQRSKSVESSCPYMQKYGQDAPREASTFL